MKQLAEKFVSIRWLLQGRRRTPQPNALLTAAIEEDYTRLANVWSDRDVREGRSNIINLNLVMAQLILKNGGQTMYDAHIEDFKQFGEPKWGELFALYSRICWRRLGYVPSCPVSTVERNKR